MTDTIRKNWIYNPTYTAVPRLNAAARVMIWAKPARPNRELTLSSMTRLTFFKNG